MVSSFSCFTYKLATRLKALEKKNNTLSVIIHFMYYETIIWVCLIY